MCGICGLVAADGELVTSARLEAMSAVIRHRGPDDLGTWASHDRAVAVGLAHRRLSIIDLSAAGHQPMTNEDGTLWLTYNGEIYNHADVRAELERAGHVYKSQTDSETILHGYEEWGERCVERFRGMFAFAIWDVPRKRLFIARDRLGVKPLYFAETADTFLFASEIKALLASGLIKPVPAEGALSEYLTFGYLAGNGTMFRGIHKLPPGHTLLRENGRTTIRPYWDLHFRPSYDITEKELQDRFKTLFEESVRLRLMSDVPLGVFLSGGLDSSAIAAVMKPMVQEPIKTFSVGYESRYYSEFSHAREVAQLVGSDHHEVVLTADDFFNALPRLVWHEDEPLWGTASVALYFVSDLAAKHVKVVLTGEGSDELFAGYDRYWMTTLNARLLGLYGRLPQSARNLVRKSLLDGPLPERARRAVGHTFIRYDNLPDGLFFDNWFGVIPPPWQQQIAGPVLRKDLAGARVYDAHRRLFNSQNGELLNRLLYTDVRASLVELLMKQDQMSMATSIESRVPFLDHKLAEFAATVPPRAKIKGFSGKHLVKAALAQYLPDSIRHRKKMGFPVPYEEWLRERYMPQVRRLLTSERALDRGWFQREGVVSILDEHLSGRTNRSRQIWALWGLELWARIFLDGMRPEMAQGGEQAVGEMSALAAR